MKQKLKCILRSFWISIANYVKNNYFRGMITSSITPQCHFENSHILAEDKLLASRVAISCSHSSCLLKPHDVIDHDFMQLIVHVIDFHQPWSSAYICEVFDGWRESLMHER